MPTYHIVRDGAWYGIAVRCGAYERHLPTLYSTREAAQRGVLALLGH